MALRINEGDPGDRMLIKRYGHEVIKLGLKQIPDLSEEEEDALREMERMLAKLGSNRYGLHPESGSVEAYTGFTSDDGEDPLRTVYTVYSDPVWKTNKPVTSRLAVVVGNPPHVYESEIGAVTEDPSRDFNGKSARLSKIYSRETENGRPFMVVTLMQPGITYAPLLARLRWDFDPGSNSIVASTQVGSKNAVIDTANTTEKTHTNLTVLNFTKARNDSVYWANKASQMS